VDRPGGEVSVEQAETRAEPAPAGSSRKAASRRLPALRGPSAEIAGYGLIAVLLAALLWSH